MSNVESLQAVPARENADLLQQLTSLHTVIGQMKQEIQQLQAQVNEIHERGKGWARTG